jgi:hypothetical protein
MNLGVDALGRCMRCGKHVTSTLGCNCQLVEKDRIEALRELEIENTALRKRIVELEEKLRINESNL